MLNIIELYKDHNISYFTEGNNVSPGWANIKCIFHSDKSNHLGFNLKKGYYFCWICGSFKIEDVLIELLSVEYREVKQIIKEYGNRPLLRNNKIKPLTSQVKSLIMPGEDLTDRHKKYLIKRNFDPEYIIDKYKIKGTGIVGDWKFRIMVPVFYENKLVTYQGRDITNKANSKYMSLKKEDSIINIKNILYNFDNCTDKNIIIVMEGVFDVWRIGDYSCCTFGTSISDAQMKLLSQYKKIVFMFDDEKEAQKAAHKSAGQLSVLGHEVEIASIGIGTDPADLSNEEAKKIKGELICG